jgi:hypothetical protein
LRKDSIQLRRHRLWCVSTDPQFAAKAADIIGLCLDPPDKALVLSVDEKPSIQALKRATGYVQTSSGKIVQGLKSKHLQAPRHGQPVCRPGDRHRGHPRHNHTDQKARRLASLFVRDHRGSAARPANPRHPRQLLHS